MIFVIIFLVLVVLPLVVLIASYNGLQRKKVRVDSAWSTIAVFLQQRGDLIPNLVETVKGFVGHEKETLIEVTKWRNQSVAIGSREEVLKADAQLSRALINLTHVVEQYPQLKADAHFSQLQSQLQHLENDISQARSGYNRAVEIFNTAVVVFPNNLMAGYFKLEERSFFVEEEQHRSAPKVKF
jgi:LemA protein